MSHVDDILYSPMPLAAESDAIKPTPAQVVLDAFARISGTTTHIVILDCNPLYECTAQCFLAGRLLHPGARIIWNDTPNHAMKPLNDAAKECYSRFIARVGAPV